MTHEAKAISEHVNIVSGITTTAIVYDEALLHSPSTAEEASPGRFAKTRICGLPELLLASSLMVTTPALSLPDLRQWEIAHLSTSNQTESGIQKGRRITIREARQIALRAHYQFEAGLRSDRIQEARLMEIAAHENDA
jgi:hypothetical protein